MTGILIVDDSATMRKIIMRTLRQVGVDIETVLQAGNGIEALEQLGANPEVGLVLCDVNMPGMSGIELVREIRKDHEAAALPIVMVTTEGGQAMRQEAMAEGANGYVSKPFTPETLLSTLESFLD